jgi:hypothetical protein
MDSMMLVMQLINLHRKPRYIKRLKLGKQLLGHTGRALLHGHRGVGARMPMTYEKKRFQCFNSLSLRPMVVPLSREKHRISLSKKRKLEPLVSSCYLIHNFRYLLLP